MKEQLSSGDKTSGYQPDRVTGERHSEGLQAVEQLVVHDARSQLMDVFLGRKGALMLAVT